LSSYAYEMKRTLRINNDKFTGCEEKELHSVQSMFNSYTSDASNNRLENWEPTAERSTMILKKGKDLPFESSM
jgi:hypothetical protein